MEMVHWVKGYKDANGRIRDAHEGDYPFAKYNKKVRAHCLCMYVVAITCTPTFTTSMGCCQPHWQVFADANWAASLC